LPAILPPEDAYDVEARPVVSRSIDCVSNGFIFIGKKS